MSEYAELDPRRVGRITASTFADAINVGEGGVFASGLRKGHPRPVPEARQRLMRMLAFERMSESAVHDIGGARALEHGKCNEPVARETFELETGLIVQPGGFFTHPVFDFVGASPDGVIDGRIGWECKAPHDESVHVRTILEGMPDDHRAQVQGGMLCSGFQGWWFCSFDPRQAPKYRLYRQFIPRDDAYIDGVLLPGLLQFNVELAQMLKRIYERMDQQEMRS